ncbi:MAG TPA: GNAT family N-acetyltransferase [Gaiellaceae bacterium]|nr:GNAT family N-acetyltransferase [Gaiellaceae bacterium]
MRVRRPTEADVAPAVELMRAVELADCGEAEWDERELRDHWATLDLERDVWLFEVDRRLAGYADLEVHAGGRVMSDGYVHPDLRGRGVGSEILRLAEEDGRRRTEDVEGRVYLQNATTSDAAEFYRARGFETVRRFRRMAIELEHEPEVTTPPGVVLRAIRRGEEPAIHELLEDAFAEHWEHRRRGYEEYAKRTFDRDDYDPTLCPVAEAGGVPVGASLNWWKEFGDWGWIGTIGVAPAFRGRGLGDALMRWSFAEFVRRGERRVALGVDAQNETGATRLYERLGMRTLWDAPVWEKELRGPAG